MQNSITFINTLNEKIARIISWGALAAVLITFTVVILRKFFDWGSIGLQESALYFHALLFMAGAAYTFNQEGHVRVDIFYQNFSTRSKAWINLFGGLLLLVPFCLFILWISADYVLASWQHLEGSREAGGLPLVFLFKSYIPLFGILLLLQAIVSILSAWMIIKNTQQQGETS
ncbi:MAG: TRAP transporter small permease subunit [Thiotrichaceae bacterium]|nr:TRAP transporter small permease subunit [Thiotrichaceae bacterium]